MNPRLFYWKNFYQQHAVLDKRMDCVNEDSNVLKMQSTYNDILRFHEYQFSINLTAGLEMEPYLFLFQ